MKTIIRLAALSAVIFSSTALFASVNSLGHHSISDPVSNDNQNKRRGRHRDDRNSSNSNLNSNSNSNSRSNSSDVSIETARKAALNAVPGTIVKEEREDKRGRSVYEFYIRKAGGDLYEVYVDANSGKVIKIESED